MSTSNERPTPGLRTIQRHFQRHVLDGSKEIVTHIVGTEKAIRDARLAVYAEGYRARLTEGLAADFPALHALLGEKGFDALARDYIDAYPSEYFSMRYLGSHLSEFLATNSVYVKMPALLEMAEFEWQLRGVFDAADADLRSVDEIGAIEPSKWGHMRFGFHPSASRLDLSWNVPAIWNAVEKDQELPMPKANGVPVPWLMWRQCLKTYFRSLTIDEASSIDALIAGQSFGEVCAQLCQWIDSDSVATHAAHLLKRWASDGLIAGVSFSE